MRQRYTFLMGTAFLMLLIAAGQSLLAVAPAAQAQTGGSAAPLPTIVLDMSPVAGAIREQGAQMVQAAQAQSAGLARLVDVQGTSVAQLVEAQATNIARLANAQATNVAQLVQEAQAQRTAIAEQSGLMLDLNAWIFLRIRLLMAFFSRPFNSSSCPMSAQKPIISALYLSLIQDMRTEVSRPPE